MSFIHLLYSPSELAANIGQNAKNLRLSKNLSRKTLAEKSGVSESTIKRFETKGTITLEAMILLATHLDALDPISNLFKTEYLSTYEELNNAKRQRGTR
ncbi:helix-turn-helix domain-containing protein [Xenorhabdus sp. IM139775]|uniref:helix-turn-helix domain-containing protein n=1 Tax=Xenorhabdus sp. IM139775 TaxID=3025876 RepID=UPI0023583AF8|nr:helix-turn-helix transcriptional regulator [Xenorhabdus sp. IM139775]MDC9592808.1 helix-turn-helix transcriptional regulator [Xenorhabdus sp. IM139775]